LSFAGEAGEVASPLGAAGAVESSTYVYAAEHADGLPAASVAVAVKAVDESAATVTANPGVEKLPAPPVATGAPVQSPDVYRRTVDPASAEPVSSGSVSFAGEPGDESSALGAAGAVESST
jgi:hypothetical protein